MGLQEWITVLRRTRTSLVARGGARHLRQLLAPSGSRQLFAERGRVVERREDMSGLYRVLKNSNIWRKEAALG